MIDPLPDSSLPGAQPGHANPGVTGAPKTTPGAIPGAGRPGSSQETDRASAGFQALLDQIETRARDLAAETDAVEAPEQLAGAVDSARESLENVLELKERLLEAYRQQQQQAAPPESTGQNHTGHGAV